MDVTIRTATVADAGAFASIYNPYVLDSCTTFETEPVAVQDMAARIRDTLHMPMPWLVAEQAGVVLGYAYANRWKPRHAYRFSVETSVYLAQEHTGRGMGKLLYRQLLDQLCKQGVHVVMAGIALPNEASIALHEKLGFAKVAHLLEIGYKHGRWVDVGYWQWLTKNPLPA